MSTRLFPDIIVASEIKQRITDVVYANDLKFGIPYSDERFQANLDNVIISIPECIERQKLYANTGLNLVAGYKNHDWNSVDYISYLNSLPKYFEPADIGKGLYRVKIKENQSNCNKNTISDLTLYICNQILTQGPYSPLLLEKFNISDNV